MFKRNGSVLCYPDGKGMHSYMKIKRKEGRAPPGRAPPLFFFLLPDRNL